jgi:flagellar L-ring protein precursor FlgH
VKIGAPLTLFVLLCAQAHAADLYQPDSWSALASDRNARKIGDSLTIIVYESATATNTASSGSSRNTDVGGDVSFGTTFSKSAKLGIQNGSDNSGTTGRSGGMIAQISAVVDNVLPNGDLHIAGSQVMNINGDKTNIRVAGRVRPSDISAANAVLSSRLADATIDYDGVGFISSSAKPGIVTRLFNWLGL